MQCKEKEYVIDFIQFKDTDKGREELLNLVRNFIVSHCKGEVRGIFIPAEDGRCTELIEDGCFITKTIKNRNNSSDKKIFKIFLEEDFKKKYDIIKGEK